MKNAFSLMLAFVLAMTAMPAMAQRGRTTEARRTERRDSTAMKIAKVGIPAAIGIGTQVWSAKQTQKVVREERQRTEKERSDAIALLNNASCGKDFMLVGANVEFRLDPRQQGFSGRGRRDRRDQGEPDVLGAVSDFFFRCGVNNLPDPEILQDLKASRGNYPQRRRMQDAEGVELEMPAYVVYVGFSNSADDLTRSRTEVLVFNRNRFEENATLAVRITILQKETAGRAIDYVTLGSAIAEGSTTVKRSIDQRTGLYDASYEGKSSLYYAALHAANTAMSNIHWNSNYRVIEAPVASAENR